MHKSLLRKLRSPKIRPGNIANAVRGARRTDTIFVLWCHWDEDADNFGDALNPVLIRWISGMEAISAAATVNWRRRPVYCVLGSILGLEGRLLEGVRRAPQVVWGAGFMYEHTRPAVVPEQVCAVRGPLSRDIYLRHGIDCPEVYGDPALLCPWFHRGEGTKRYRLGIVPHYYDKASPHVDRLRKSPDVCVVDIENGVLQVIDEITRCERIVSSSLHGMVIADAYGIPSAWTQLSGQVAAQGFKFRDYLASVGREGMEPVRLSGSTTVAELEQVCNGDTLSIDLDRLWDACPLPRLPGRPAVRHPP